MSYGEKQFSELEPGDLIVWNGAIDSTAEVRKRTSDDFVSIAWAGKDGLPHGAVIKWRPDDTVYTVEGK